MSFGKYLENLSILNISDFNSVLHVPLFLKKKTRRITVMRNQDIGFYLYKALDAIKMFEFLFTFYRNTTVLPIHLAAFRNSTTNRK